MCCLRRVLASSLDSGTYVHLLWIFEFGSFFLIVHHWSGAGSCSGFICHVSRIHHGMVLILWPDNRSWSTRLYLSFSNVHFLSCEIYEEKGWYLVSISLGVQDLVKLTPSIASTPSGNLCQRRTILGTISQWCTMAMSSGALFKILRPGHRMLLNVGFQPSRTWCKLWRLELAHREARGSDLQLE